MSADYEAFLNAIPVEKRLWLDRQDPSEQRRVLDTWWHWWVHIGRKIRGAGQGRMFSDWKEGPWARNPRLRITFVRRPSNPLEAPSRPVPKKSARSLVSLLDKIMHEETGLDPEYWVAFAWTPYMVALDIDMIALESVVLDVFGEDSFTSLLEERATKLGWFVNLNGWKGGEELGLEEGEEEAGFVFQPFFTKKVRPGRYLFHVSPAKNSAKIKRHGLKPKGISSLDSSRRYPPRVYLFKTKRGANKYASKWKKKREGFKSAVIWRVDTKKLTPRPVFYEDPEFLKKGPGPAVFTYTEIPPEAVEKVAKNPGQWARNPDAQRRAVERAAAAGDPGAQLRLDVWSVREGTFPLCLPTNRIRRVVKAMLSPEEIRSLTYFHDLRSRDAWLELVAYLQEPPEPVLDFKVGDTVYSWEWHPKPHSQKGKIIKINGDEVTVRLGRRNYKRFLGTLSKKPTAGEVFEHPASIRRRMYKPGTNTGAVHAAQWLDKTRVGTPLYGGLAYFWAMDYKHTLRDVPQFARKAIHDTWLKHGLELDGVSSEHERLMNAVLRTPRGWEWEDGDLIRSTGEYGTRSYQIHRRKGALWKPPSPLPNPDPYARSLEREAAATGDLHARARLLRERVRAGELPMGNVELACVLAGRRCACLLAGSPPHHGMYLRADRRDLVRWAVALARNVAWGGSPSTIYRRRDLLKAIDTWIRGGKRPPASMVDPAVVQGRNAIAYDAVRMIRARSNNKLHLLVKRIVENYRIMVYQRFMGELAGHHDTRLSPAWTMTYKGEPVVETRVSGMEEPFIPTHERHVRVLTGGRQLSAGDTTRGMPVISYSVLTLRSASTRQATDLLGRMLLKEE